MDLNATWSSCTLYIQWSLSSVAHAAQKVLQVTRQVNKSTNKGPSSSDNKFEFLFCVHLYCTLSGCFITFCTVPVRNMDGPVPSVRLWASDTNFWWVASPAAFRLLLRAFKDSLICRLCLYKRGRCPLIAPWGVVSEKLIWTCSKIEVLLYLLWF